MPERISRAVPPPSGRKPRLNIASRQVAGLLKELKAYHRLFAPLFRRKEQRHWSQKYLEGQMLDIERKAIQPMANALEGGNVQAMQQFISQGAWPDTPIIQTHQAQVAETLGQPAGVLIVDGCDYPKQGDDSVGVARQYCGPLGKIANCQASVVLAYASERGYTLLDRRLYMPKEWFDDAHRERWKQCGIPDEVTFQTKPELGWDMLAPVIRDEVIPFRWVAMDAGFGRDTGLLGQIHAQNRHYFAETPCSTRAWRRQPSVLPPPARAPLGRPATRPQLSPEAPKSERVDHIARQLRGKRWHTDVIHEGSKGPLVVERAALRVVMVEDGLPGREEWLVIRRTSDRQPPSEWKFYRSNAPADTPLKTLAGLTAWRWPVETTIEECKGELGADHYEVRGWLGWHHHTTMTMLSHHFLVRLRVQMGDDAPALTVSQVRKLLQTVLPRREFDPHTALAALERTQRQNYAAYRSHRKRRLRELKASHPK